MSKIFKEEIHIKSMEQLCDTGVKCENIEENVSID
jgi:hypothetical protein